MISLRLFMNKILSPLLLLLLVIIAYQSFEFQSASSKKLEDDLLKERSERGHYYCKQIVHELQYLPKIDKIFLDFLTQLTSIQPDEIIAINLNIDGESMTLWKHPAYNATTSKDKKFACFKSEEFTQNGTKCNVMVFLQPGESLKTLSKLKSLHEQLTVLLMAVVFASALFSIFMLYSKHKKEKTRIQDEMRQKEKANQLEIIKREKDASEMRSQMYAKEQQLRHADKMNSLGTLASSMAHEINNPNTYIALNAETLDKAWRDVLDIINSQINEETKIAGIPYKLMRERIPTLTQAIKEGSDRIQKIVADLKHFAGLEKTKDSQKVIVNLKNVVDSSLRLTTNFISKYTDFLIVENEKDLFILGYEQRLEQVIVNLLINSAQSLTSKENKIKLRTYSEQNEVKLEVSDQGCGISEENLKKIFDPFFTTKTESGGTGLGLSISNGIINDMMGRIKVESTVGKGSTFTIILPEATSL